MGQQTISTPFGLTIEGTGPSASATVIDAGGTVRAFLLTPTLSNLSNAAFVFQDLTIQHGLATDDGQGGNTAEGGGILALPNVNTLALNGVVLRSNIAQGGSTQDAMGGGLFINSGSLTILSSLIQNNQVLGGSGIGNEALGGGIFAQAPTTISGSTLANNQAAADFGQGGGAWLGNQTTIINSTIANNSASAGSTDPTAAAGGGLFFSKGPATLINVTVAYNQVGGTSRGEGGGIEQVSGANPQITLINTLVALNSADRGADFNGAVFQSDRNLIGNADGSTGFSASNGDRLGTTAAPINPGLGALADNGGLTPTIALLPGSPAISAGDPNAGGSFDQRGLGFPRVVFGVVDIGAFQTQSNLGSGALPGGGGGGGSDGFTPPNLNKPPLMALLDTFLKGVEAVFYGSRTETVTDNFFGLLLVSTYDQAGNLHKVTLLGFGLSVDVTSLVG